MVISQNPHSFAQPPDASNSLFQELSAAQESSRVKSAKLRECEMQLDIALTESQLVQRKLENALDELLLEKSRREEEEKEHQRLVVEPGPRSEMYLEWVFTLF